MGTFGSALWGGGGSSGGVTPTVGVPLSSLIMPAYRVAGLIDRAMITPSEDMYAEAIPELNRMIGTWNCDRPKIFTIAISDLFPLSGSIEIFNVGPGATPQTVNGVNYGAFDMPRPQAIQNGVISFLTSSPPVDLPPMYQMDDDEWARVALKQIPGAVPLAFYFDGSYDTTTGWSKIYLYPQTSGGYGVTWYTWQSIPTFQTKDDNVALPPGYEAAIVYNLAKRLAALNPKDQVMQPVSYDLARESLSAIENHNRPTVKITSDFPSSGGRHYDYRIGFDR